VISDFANDICITFPEHQQVMEKWRSNINTDDLLFIYQYCLTVYPKRFFDILYQNDDLFKSDSEHDTAFFPGLDFKILFGCTDISENTKKSLWKYLQLVLFTIVQDIKDKSSFGDSMNFFEGIEEKDLHEKLKDTMTGISDFFNKMKDTTQSNESSESSQQKPSPFEMPNFEDFAKGAGMLNMENIHEHLKTLFDGKIGSLAKEMAEEITEEFKEMLGDEADQLRSTEDAMKLFMKDPKKLMDLMKKISTKLDKKMQNGEISRDEMMKEASEMINKMKEMGGGEKMKEMFEKFAKGMGGMGKNMRMDMNALNRMTSSEDTRTRLRSKLQEKKDKQREAIEKLKAERQQSVSTGAPSNYSLESVTPDDLVFRLAGNESQEKSSLKSLSEKADKMAELLIQEESTKKESVAKKSKKKNKKNK
jgi:hypothetical protein